MAIGYAKSADSNGIADQENSIREWAAKNGYTLLGVFKDNGPEDKGVLSGDVFQALLKFCRDNGVRVILAVDLSRFGKNLIEATQIIKQLHEEGYTIVFTKYGLKVDPNTVTGRSVLYSLLMAAELEKELTLVRLGSVRGGRRIGRPPKEIDEKELLRLRKKGLSVRAIAKIMDVSKSTVWRRLKELEGVKR